MNVGIANDTMQCGNDRISLADPLEMFDSEKSVTSAPARPLVMSPRVERATAHENNKGWFASALMLCVAVLAGYTAGLATAYRNPERQSLSAVPWQQVARDSSLPPAPVPAVDQRAGDGEVAQAEASALRRPPARDDSPATRQPRDVSQVAAAAPPKTLPVSGLGALHIVSKPNGAQVYLDGRLVTTTPFQLSEVRPGSHTLRMELDGYKPWSASVHVVGGEVVRIAASLQ